MKTRKLLALVLAIAMIATVFVVPSAAVAPGAACEILGLLEGDGEGVTAEYLAKGTTRAQGLLITLRAKGLEAEAKAFTGTGTFTDAADVNADFWGPILAYAYANPNLGWVGDGDGTFRPADVMTGAELAKVMLALLGYTQGVDFEWADIATFAASKGVTVAEGNATNDDLAASLVEAIALETKTGSKLVDAMIADGVVTEEDALAAEVKEAPVVGAFTVAVTGVKTIKATFAEAQDTATAVVSLKKGVVGQAVTVTWDTAKKVATLAKTTNLTKGDYTVTINGEAVDFTVAADETATELVVGATTLYSKAGIQDLQIHLLNQYGEKMNYAQPIVGGASAGQFTVGADTASLDIAKDANGGAVTTAKAGTVITVFAYYAPKNFTVNTTITVVEDQKLASIVFGSVTLGTASKDLTRLTEATTGNTLSFKAYDQYGKEVNLTQAPFNASYSLVTSSNVTYTVGNGVITLSTVAKGTMSFRAIITSAAVVSELFTAEVYATPALAAIEMTVPEAIYATSAANITFTGTDQYGKAISVAKDVVDAMTISFLSTSGQPTKGTTDVGKLPLTFPAAGSGTLYITSGTINLTAGITVLAAKKVAEISSVTVAGALQLGNVVTIDTGVGKNVALKDQYGNAIAIDPANYAFKLERLADSNLLGVVSTDTNLQTIVTIAGTTITAQKAGTEQLRLTYYTSAYAATDTNNYKEFTYDFPITVVAAKDIVTYELKVSKATMYNGAGSRVADHDLTITLVGKMANGTEVALTTAAGQLPLIAAKYTVTGTGAQIVGNKLTQLAADVEGTVTLKAWNNTGVAIGSVDVALVKAVPKIDAVTLTYKDNVATLAAEDQYGVTITAPTGTFYSSTTDVGLGAVTVGATTTVALTGTAGKTGTVRFVSDTGAWALEVAVTLK